MKTISSGANYCLGLLDSSNIINTRKFVAGGFRADNSSVASTLSANNAVFIYNGITASGAFALDSSAVSVTGTLAVTGIASLNGGFNAASGSITGVLGVTGATTLGALSVTSETISTTLAVTGATSLNGGLSTTNGTFSGTLGITGLTSLDGGFNAASGSVTGTLTLGTLGSLVTIDGGIINCLRVYADNLQSGRSSEINVSIGAGSYSTQTITFDSAFTLYPFVVFSVYSSDVNAANANLQFRLNAVDSKTDFQVYIINPTGGTLNFHGYINWIAYV